MTNSDDISNLIQSAALVLARQSDQILLEQLGIGWSQYRILRVIKLHDAISQRKISHLLGQTEASISRQIKILTEDGLISHEQLSTNRRVHISSLTIKGIRITDSAIDILAKHDSAIFGNLSDKQRRQLSLCLESITSGACDSTT